MATRAADWRSGILKRADNARGEAFPAARTRALAAFAESSRGQD
jgi:hypothetical protein